MLEQSIFTAVEVRRPVIVCTICILYHVCSYVCIYTLTDSMYIQYVRMYAPEWKEGRFPVLYSKPVGLHQQRPLYQRSSTCGVRTEDQRDSCCKWWPGKSHQSWQQPTNQIGEQVSMIPEPTVTPKPNRSRSDTYVLIRYRHAICLHVIDIWKQGISPWQMHNT